jgi:SOS-response transcriptional repressor LexA
MQEEKHGLLGETYTRSVHNLLMSKEASKEIDAVAVGSRIRELRKERGWTQKQLSARATAISMSRIGNYEQGTRTLDVPTAIRLAEAFGDGVSAAYILGIEKYGVHPRIANDGNLPKKAPTAPPPCSYTSPIRKGAEVRNDLWNLSPQRVAATRRNNNTVPGPDIRGRIPLISWVQAGEWTEMEVIEHIPEDAPRLACPVSHGSHTFALRVEGNSMYNPGGNRSFQPGDLIFVDPDSSVHHMDLAVVRLDDESAATFKEYHEKMDGKYLFALNPNWEPRNLKINGNATVIGRVIFWGREP